MSQPLAPAATHGRQDVYPPTAGAYLRRRNADAHRVFGPPGTFHRTEAIAHRLYEKDDRPVEERTAKTAQAILQASPTSS